MWIIVFLLICVSFIIYSVTKGRKLFNRIVFNLYFFAYYSCFMLVLIIWPFPILNGRTVNNGKSWSRLLKHMTKFLEIKWELRNREVLAKDQGAVIVTNHQTSLDVIGVFHLWETAGKICAIAKKSLRYAGPVGVVFYFIGVIFIDRDNPMSAYKQLETAKEVIKEKVKIWFCPEGTRNFDWTKILPFKKGAFTLAVAAQVPIIPLIYSPYYFIDRKNYTFNKGRVIIQCLDEVSTTGLTKQDVPELIERVRNMMLTAYKELSDEVLPTKRQTLAIRETTSNKE